MKLLLLLFFATFISYAQVYVPDSKFDIPLKPADTVATTYLSIVIKNKYANEYLIKGEVDFLDNKPVKPNTFHCIRYVRNTKNIITWDSLGVINTYSFLFVRKNGNYVLMIDNVLNEISSEGKVVNKINPKRIMSGLVYQEMTDKIHFVSNVNDKQYLYSLDFKGKLDSTANKERFNIYAPFFITKYDDKGQCNLYKTNEKFEIDTTFQKISCSNGIFKITNANEIITTNGVNVNDQIVKRYSINGKKIDSLLVNNVSYLSNSVFISIDTKATNKLLLEDYAYLDIATSYRDETQYFYKFYFLTDNLELKLIDNTFNQSSNILRGQIMYGYAIDKDGNLYFQQDFSKKIVNCKTLMPYRFVGLRQLTDSTFLGLERRNDKEFTNYTFFTNEGKKLFNFPNTKFNTHQEGNTLLTNGDTLFHVTPDLKLYKYKDTLSGKAYYVDFKHQFLYQVTPQKQILKFSLITKKQDFTFKINENLSIIKHISFYKNGDLAVSAFSDSVQNRVLFLRISSNEGNTITKIQTLPSYKGGASCQVFSPTSSVTHEVLNDEKNVAFYSLESDGGLCNHFFIVNLESVTYKRIGSPLMHYYFDESDKKERIISDSNSGYVILDLLTSQQIQNFQLSRLRIFSIKKIKEGFIAYGSDKIYRFIDDVNTPYLFTNYVLGASQTPKKYKIPYYYRGAYKLNFEIIEGKSTIEGDSLVVYQGKTLNTQTYADEGKIKISATDVEPVILPYYAYPDKKLNENTLPVVVLAREQESEDSFKVYPNPINNDSFEIETLRNVPIKNITLTDMQGRVYFPFNFQQGNKYFVNTTFANDGIYILTFENDRQKIQKRVVINH